MQAVDSCSILRISTARCRRLRYIADGRIALQTDAQYVAAKGCGVLRTAAARSGLLQATAGDRCVLCCVRVGWVSACRSAWQQSVRYRLRLAARICSDSWRTDPLRNAAIRSCREREPLSAASGCVTRQPTVNTLAAGRCRQSSYRLLRRKLFAYTPRPARYIRRGRLAVQRIAGGWQRAVQRVAGGCSSGLCSALLAAVAAGSIARCWQL